MKPAPAQGIPLGRFVLGPRLAVGGTGEVYVAIQTGLGQFQKPLALKLLLSHLAESPRAVKMFLDEAHLAARMNHPNVVQIFDVGVEDGRYFIAMEMIHGVSLATLIRALKRAGQTLSERVLVYVARALCDGLHHAHEQVGADGEPLNIVHRDVTPHNVMVSLEGQVKLTDFGIAKARSSSSATRPGTIKGKFAYLAPEQIWGGVIDRRADVFATGVTLFQLATLRSPFLRDSDAATLKAIEVEELPSLFPSRPDLPLTLDEALRKATRRDPADRFRSARALRDALPVPEIGAAEELGALVRELCGQSLQELEHKTIAGRSFHTEGLIPLQHPALREMKEREPRLRRWVQATRRAARRPVVWAVLGPLALVLAFLAGVNRSEPRAPAPAPAGAVAPTTARAIASSDGQRRTPALALEPIPSSPPPPVSASVEQARVAPEEEDSALATIPPTAPPRTAESRARTLGRERPLRPRSPAFGQLTIDAQPWASVFLEGKAIGDTPIASFPVEPGTWTLVLKNPETGKSTKRRIKVEAGRRKFVRVDLR